MVQIRKCILVAAALLVADSAAGRKFYPDDPIQQDPPPLPVETAKSRRINEYYDFFLNTFFEPDRDLKQTHSPRPSAAVNTLGEVPDTSWFTNRIGTREMSIEELVRGPGNESPPSMDGPWNVLSGKNEGITPGLIIEDSRKRRYLLKFDPLEYPEMASAADVIGSKFFHALGYNVPENYIVRFTGEQLKLTEKTKFTDDRGREREMRRIDLNRILMKVPRDSEGNYRALASLFIKGELIGPFKFHKTRRDDPNDIVPHEDRRDLRGLYVFAAWLNHTDSKALNTLDAIVEENGLRYIKHYIIDFGAILGSDSFTEKSPRAGHVYLFDRKPAAWQFLTLGLYVTPWMRVDYPDLPSVGNFDYEAFEPERWKSNYPNPAFDMRTPGDTYWAAKKVMAFSDEAIRALVATGEYSNPEAAEYVTRCVIERRNRAGRAFIDDVLPLDNFRVNRGTLEYEDLAVRYGFEQPRKLTIAWSAFDNETERKTPIEGANDWRVPRRSEEYLAADIRGPDARKTVTVYLRGTKVVGIDRTW